MSTPDPFLNCITASVLSNHTLFVSQIISYPLKPACRKWAKWDMHSDRRKFWKWNCILHEKEYSVNKTAFLKHFLSIFNFILSIPWVPIQDDDSSDFLLQDSVWLVRSASESPCAHTWTCSSAHLVAHNVASFSSSLLISESMKFGPWWRICWTKREKGALRDHLAPRISSCNPIPIWNSRQCRGQKEELSAQKGNHFWKLSISPTVGTFSLSWLHRSGSYDFSHFQRKKCQGVGNSQ